ncbi:MAG TPA: TolC family protein [Anaeromyxobacteraceae bacterium]|nr:TolC family protein [Anaeromyxobacteraceae bacterium]
MTSPVRPPLRPGSAEPGRGRPGGARARALCALLAAGLCAPGRAGAADATPSLPKLQGGTLSLDQATRTTWQNQPQIVQARANTQAAEARADEARAPLLPQVTGVSYTYERTTSNFTPHPGYTPTLALPPLYSWQTYNYYNFNGTVSQLVWDFGATLDAWRSAKVKALSQRDTERYTELQVLLGVRTAYFTARASKDLVAVARETLANQEAHLRQTEGFVEVGTQPEIALAQSRYNVANARVQLITAENNYVTAKAQLNQAMGVEGPTDYDVATETFAAVSGEDDSNQTLLAQALAHRPDFKSDEEQIDAQRLTVSSVKGTYWPSIGVQFNWVNAGIDPFHTVWNWNVQATLNWNIYQGGLTVAQQQEQEANLTSLVAQTDQLRQQVRLDVEQARLAVLAAKASLSAAADALTNAKDLLRLAEGRYEVGIGSIIELSDAQVAETSAAAQRVQADYNLASARAQLLRALGDLGPFAALDGSR